MKPYAATMIALLALQLGLAQPGEINFGTVMKSELAMPYCSFDSTANAMVIFDVGELHFTLDKRGDVDFNTDLERKIRIKIFNEEGYDNATFEIPVYARGGRREKLTGIKGTTYNLVNNKIVKTKLSKDAIYKEKLTERVELVKFSFPNVKPGSIIELEYSINSDYLYTLHDWQFQKDIPVYWSEFSAFIPEYFQYNTLVIGSSPVVSEPAQKVNEYFGELRIATQKFHWHAHRLAGIPKESYVASLNNFRTNLQFELAGIVDGNIVKPYAHNWANIAKQQRKNKSFGGYVNAADYPVRSISKSDSPSLSKAHEIFDQVKYDMQWSGYRTVFATEKPSRVIEEGKGNTAEINLLLCGTLRKHGYVAHPVVLSTRENGTFVTYSYRFTQFDYVITALQVDTTWYLLDASQDQIPFGYLPQRCLNQNGLLIADSQESIIDIGTSDTYKINSHQKINLNISEASHIDVTNSYFQHAAFKIRSDYYAADEESFDTRLKKANPGYDIENVEILYVDSLDKPVKLMIQASHSSLLEDIGESKIVTLTDLFDIRENPFINEERVLPIDFAVPSNYNYLIEIVLPENYTVSTIPEPFRMVTENNGMSFAYQANHIGNKIHINARFNIDRTKYSVSEYETIRNFFSQYLSKISEPIELIPIQ
jgi:hypothetical protein